MEGVGWFASETGRVALQTKKMKRAKIIARKFKPFCPQEAIYAKSAKPNTKRRIPNAS